MPHFLYQNHDVRGKNLKVNILLFVSFLSICNENCIFTTNKSKFSLWGTQIPAEYIYVVFWFLFGVSQTVIANCNLLPIYELLQRNAKLRCLF